MRAKEEPGWGCEEEGQPIKPGTRNDEGLTRRLEFGMGAVHE